MDDRKEEATAVMKRLQAQLQQRGAKSEEQMQEVNNSKLGHISSGLPPQQNQSGYELGRFRHPSETSPRGQVMLTTTQDASTPKALQTRSDTTEQSVNDHTNAKVFASRMKAAQPTSETMTQKDHKKEVAPASATVTESSQSPAHSEPKRSEADASKKSMLDRYSSQPKPSDQNRNPEKAPQQDKGHER